FIAVALLMVGLVIGAWPKEVLAQRDAARTDRERLQQHLREKTAENLQLLQRAQRMEKAYAALHTWAYGAPPQDGVIPGQGDTAA
ncbi:hypothetical protein, partial [Actinocorallia libanotica]